MHTNACIYNNTGLGQQRQRHTAQASDALITPSNMPNELITNF